MKKKHSYSSLNEHMLLDPEYFAKLQPELDRYMRKNPRFSIDQIRENLGVTREELAIQMSTAPENVAELENKGMDISVWDLYYLLDGLGCDLEIHAKRNGKKMRLRFGPGTQANCG